jgi:hypothetical protein
MQRFRSFAVFSLGTVFLGSLSCGGEDNGAPSTTRASCVTETICVDYVNQSTTELEARRQMCSGRWMAERCLSDPAVGGCVTDRMVTWFYRDATGNPTAETLVETCHRNGGTVLPPR